MNSQRRHEINEYRGQMLLPELWEDLKDVLSAIEEGGWSPMITQSYRSPQEQDALYAQGRRSVDEVNSLRKIAGLDPIKESDNKIVTRAKSGQSLHEQRRAVDLVQYEDGKSPDWDNHEFYATVWKYLEPLGWRWGHLFKSIDDEPHYEK